MEEYQRAAMYEGWKNSKTWLKVEVNKTAESCVVSTEYEGKRYSKECLQKFCVGSADTFSVAFGMLESAMKAVNKSIELEIPKIP